MNAQIIETESFTVIVIPKTPSLESAELQKMAALWDSGMRVEDIGDAMGINGRDLTQNLICGLRKVFPDLFPYRTVTKRIKSNKLAPANGKNGAR